MIEEIESKYEESPEVNREYIQKAEKAINLIKVEANRRKMGKMDRNQAATIIQKRIR